MPAQDDVREEQMILLFNLTKPPYSRSGIDAYLELDELRDPLPFELKSTTTSSVSTVRDMGPEHIEKWRKLHWLFAFYEKDARKLKHCSYASPAQMAKWIKEKEAYVRPDLVFASRAPEAITDDTLTEILGDAHSFTAKDAFGIMKMQWSKQQYQENADLPDYMYSRARMVEVLRERCAYVIRRGATLNNPHINQSFLQELEPITRDHAATLRVKVREYLAERAAVIAAGGQPIEDQVDPVVATQAALSEAIDNPADDGEE